MAAPIEEVCLIDAEDNKEYKIILSSGDAEKARRNMNFATLLLAKAKEQYMLPQATSERCQGIFFSSVIRASYLILCLLITAEIFVIKIPALLLGRS
ncbi:uncharacterized protein LOC112589229 isoform X2 [Harpegnathos saltator]|nr:uncharacterized protein LOC112589229 isoform X2 [Harpegnathos saltator]